MIKKNTKASGLSLMLSALSVASLLAGCQSFSPQTAQLAEPVSHSENEQNKPQTAIDEPTLATSTSVHPYLPLELPPLEMALDADPQHSSPGLNEAEASADLITKEIQIEAETALAEQNNAWIRLQKGMQMSEVDNKRVKAQLDWYLKHRSYLDRVMKRAEPILPFILDEIEKKGLPTELALLPIVESAYQAFAYSHGRASGMWQIIPSTGRHLGLKQNWWYDGRRDIIESTRAALTYLDTLAGQFNRDWELALASYNAGPGKIRSAIRYNKKKGRKTDFWSLTRLRRETLDYVPKLVALKAIFADPDKYGIDLLHIEDEHSYEIVELDSQIDLALAADLAGLSTEQLYQLNPAFNRWATAPNGPHRLLLPKENIGQFKKQLAELPKSKRINWVRHKIQSGDTLSQLAVKYRTTASLIRQVNEIRGNNIRAGKYLLIPTATRSLKEYGLSQSARLSKIRNTQRGGSSQKTTYTVKSGDSFWSISRKYGVSTRSLAKWNGMAPIDTLRVGQKLVIWKKPGNAKAQKVGLMSTSPQNKLHALRYTVRKGDSLSRIADKFNIRVSDIKRWNKVGKYLQPGQKLKLFVDITRQSG